MSVERHHPAGMLLSLVLGQSASWRGGAWRRTDGAKRDPLSDRLHPRGC